MIVDLTLFLFSVALGGVLRVLYAGAARLAKSTRLKAVCYIFDALWCAVSAFSYAALVLFFADGVFKTFTLLGLLCGLGFGSLFFVGNPESNAPRATEKQPADRQPAEQKETRKKPRSKHKKVARKL